MPAYCRLYGVPLGGGNCLQIQLLDIDIQGLANSFHNYGAVMAGWTVQSDYAQKFRDEDLSIANGTLSSSYLKNNKGGLYAVGGEVVTGTGFSYNQ